MSREAVERRLAAILSADVVGYSRLMAEDEDATVRTLAAYRDEIGLLVRQHRGRVVDSPGDNLLAEFSTATEAVACAIEIQGVLGVRNAHFPPDRRMEFRIGVHVGEVRVEAERIHGDGVNIAARLQALAEPAGICVSGAVQEQIGKKLAVSYRDLGLQSLKNIPEPVRAYRVRSEEVVAAPKVAPRGRRWGIAVAALAIAAAVFFGGWRLLAPRDVGAPEGPIRSIAVLPLENLSGDPEQEYFADGMTEELIGELAKIRALRVISRTSVMRYKQTDKSIPEIAAELGVDGALEGTVTREQGRVRITVQLIDGRTDTHLWADHFDRELSSVLALRSDVARAVAEQVRAELTPGARAALAASRSVDPRAYDAYLRGLEVRGRSYFPAVWAPRAIEQFERAVELDPDFPEAHAALANARVWLAGSPFDFQPAKFPKAREAAQRALELDDSLGGAHADLGSILLLHEWDFEAALRAYERAVEISPSDPTALNNYAYYLLVVGRIDEALEVMEQLLRVAPFDRFYRGVRVRNLGWARQYERALGELEQLREQDAQLTEFDEVMIYFQLGRVEEAHHAHVVTYERCGQPCDWMRQAIERGWSEGGWNAAIRRLAEAGGERPEYAPGLVGLWYSVIGDTEQALTWLERGYRERDPAMVLINLQGWSDSLRSDPRFQDLLRRIGFPEP